MSNDTVTAKQKEAGMNQQREATRTKIFIRVDYLSAYKAGRFKMPGDPVCSTVPFREYFRKLFGTYKKKFMLMEISVPKTLKQEDREGFAAKIAETAGFAELPYKATYFEKGDCHSFYFLLCEYIYYPEAIEAHYKTVHIDAQGHYCSADVEGAVPLEIKQKTNISKKHEIFKADRSAFIVQMKTLKEKIGELIRQFSGSYEKGIFINKFRYKELPYFQTGKAHVLNDVLEQCDNWLNDLDFMTPYARSEEKSRLFLTAVNRMNQIVKKRKWKMSRNHTINLFSRAETKNSFLHRCGNLIGDLRSELLACS